MLKVELLIIERLVVILKAPQGSGTDSRRVSFACRFAGMAGPMIDAKGKPTRKALALKKWGFSSEAAARNFCNTT
jgi:hypothetical protein